MDPVPPEVAPLDGFTVAGLIRRLAQAQPDHEMLVAGPVRRTWSEEYRLACRVAQACRRDGVAAGDRVALLDRNGLPYFDVLFGGALIGAVNVAVNWRLAPREMAEIIDDAAARVLVVHADYLAAVSTMGALPAVERIVVVDDPGAPGSPCADPRAIPYAHWLDGCAESDPGHVGRPDEVSLQLYTSGTTGLPKGVMLTNANLSTAVSEAGRTFSISADTVSLVAMPLFHIGGSGWALCGMSRGGRSVILRDVDPGVLLQLIEREGISEMFVVPAVLMMLLATPSLETTDLSSLRHVFYGASPISEDVLVRCMDAFACGFNQVYGLTETTGAITALRAGDHDPEGPRRYLLRSAGRPHDGVEIRIVDPDSRLDCGPGQVGEIWTRSAYNMAGYWGKPAETADTVGADGWLRTGDAGYLDDEGYLYLHDRMKDMIISGGENVYPAEVENVLLSHRCVADAAVIGVPDARWGETVKAIVVPAAGIAFDEEDVMAHCRANLARYKAPTSVDLTDALPRNPSGKILKRELRAPFWADRDRHIN
ncbi:MAG: long-chain-fatty-acid--CoA ligase [Acidimicrobiales bacterium]